MANGPIMPKWYKELSEEDKRNLDNYDYEFERELWRYCESRIKKRGWSENQYSEALFGDPTIIQSMKDKKAKPRRLNMAEVIKAARLLKIDLSRIVDKVEIALEEKGWSRNHEEDL